MKIRCIFDLHLYSRTAIRLNFNPKDPNEYLGGGIVNFGYYCEDTNQAHAFYNELKSQYGKRYIDGSYERMGKDNQVIQLDNAIIVHGDFESMGSVRAVKERSRPWDTRKYRSWTFMTHDVTDRPPHDKMLERLVEKAKYHQVNTIICGHIRPKAHFEKTIDNVRIIVCKRGVTEINV